MAKMTARDRLLQECFQGQYKGELPTDDKGMFALISGVCMVKITNSLYDFANISAKKDDFEGRASKRGSAILSKLITTIENGIKEYICEVKGFKKGYTSKQYIDWFNEMSKRFSAREEEFYEMCTKNSNEIWEILHGIISSEIENKINYLNSKDKKN